MNIQFKGFWRAEAYGPIVVADPLKFRALVGLPKIKQPAGVIAMSRLERLLKPLSAKKRQEVERLLSAGTQLWSDDMKVSITDEGWAWHLSKIRPWPTLKWADSWTNIVVNEGINHALDVTLSAGTPDTTWFVGLTDGTPTVAAGDTLASHAGWVEVTNYDETNRVAWVDGGVSSQSVSNSASPAVFTISATVTVGGAFLAGVNTGTAGTLYAAASFTGGDKSLADNDTLTVTATMTGSAT